MAPTLRERLSEHFMHAELLGIAIYSFLAVALETILQGRFADLEDVRAKGFARFWVTVSPPAKPQTAAPAEMQGAFAPLPGMLASASGDVLELGPGSGAMFVYYNASQINSFLVAEPTTELNDALRTSAGAVGLGEKFTILSCGAQSASLVPALSKAGLLNQDRGVTKQSADGVFDTIVSVRSLCSIPDLAESLETHYHLLRPGGRFVICEHVINPWRSKGGSVTGRACQYLYTAFGWTYFVGDCDLSRDIVGMLYEAAKADGGWGSVELQRDCDWKALPFVTGVFTKKGRSSLDERSSRRLEDLTRDL